MEGGQGGRWGATKVHWFPLFTSLKNLTTGLIWLVTRVGGWGGGVGRWPMEGGEGGEMGGGLPFLTSLQNPTTGLIWLVTRG